MKEKFLIGEISRLFSVSTDTLRHYDRLDILKPEQDNNNNYRYYDIRSIFKLSRILFLKSLGISLSEIKSYMKNKNSDKLLTMLKSKEDEIDSKIMHLMNLKHKIQSKVELLENYMTDLDVIKIKKLDKRYGIFLNMNEFSDEYEIKQEFKRSGKYLSTSSWLIEGQIYTSISKSDMDKGIFNRFRYFIEIDAIEEDMRGSLEEFNENIYACMIVLGPYSEMVSHYKTLVAWIYENGYEIVGDSIEKNIVDYDSTEFERDYVSEIQIPIKKI